MELFSVSFLDLFRDEIVDKIEIKIEIQRSLLFMSSLLSMESGQDVKRDAGLVWAA